MDLITVLGFDFGTKKIGVAIGQTITHSARELMLIKVKDGIPEWNVIQKIIHEWKPNILIVGYPINMDGSSQILTEMAEQFGRELELRFGLTVCYVDERLTSVEARATLFEEGGYRALRKKPIDGIAAKLIVEDWFKQQEQKKCT